MEQQPTYHQLLNENKELRWQLEEANDAIEAIRTGQVDALIVNDQNGAQLYTLKSADQTYRLFIEKMNEGAVALNREGVILYSNSRFAKLVGLPLEQVMGFNFMNFVCTDDRNKINQIINSSWEQDCKIEVFIDNKLHQSVPCLLSCNAMDFEDGVALSLIITNLSKQKETQKQLELQFDQLEEAQVLTQKLNDDLEETVKERTKDLTISREYLNLLTNNIPQMSWTNLPSGEINFYNQRWYDYTGFMRKEMPDGRFREAIHPDDFSQVVGRFEASLKTGNIFEAECRYRRADGQYRWFLNRGIPLLNENGDILFWVGTATDIEQQKQEMDKKDEFIGIASHELKTPLTSLKGYIQIMGMYKKDEVPAAIKQYIAKALNAVNKLQNLINDLLDVSKIQAGRLDYHMDDTDLSDMVTASVDNAIQIYPEHTFEREVAPLLMVHGNPERLEQVLMNFVSNAVKYSADGSRVIIKAYTTDSQVRVAVTDFGIGLTAGQQEKIFERFYRVEDKTYSTSGLGMGLFISSEIIKTHKGRIYVESELQKGSTFYFELPLVR